MSVGVSFFGPRWTEPRLIALAYAFEQATAVRQAPTQAPSITVLAQGGRPPAPPLRFARPLRCSP